MPRQKASTSPSDAIIEIGKKYIDNINDSIRMPHLQSASLLPSSMQEHEIDPAQEVCRKLYKYIVDFERDLDNDHEVGAALASFGSKTILYIEYLSYGPSIIIFDGFNEYGDKVKLIQHVSQLSVLLVALKKREDKPNRIGFQTDRKE